MKSFLQYISESELDFYLSPVKDYSVYMDIMNGNINDITKELTEKVNMIQHLGGLGYNVDAFKDKTTFKMFNELEWDITKFSAMQDEYKINDIPSLVEAWSQSIINKEE